jgi:hypothetical protein
MAGARQEPHSFCAPNCQAAKNPGVSGTRKIASLLSQLDRRFRVMVLLDAASGLRRSELCRDEGTQFERLNHVLQPPKPSEQRPYNEGP